MQQLLKEAEVCNSIFVSKSNKNNSGHIVVAESLLSRVTGKLDVRKDDLRKYCVS